MSVRLQCQLWAIWMKIKMKITIINKELHQKFLLHHQQETPNQFRRLIRQRRRNRAFLTCAWCLKSRKLLTEMTICPRITCSTSNLLKMSPFCWIFLIIKINNSFAQRGGKMILKVLENRKVETMKNRCWRSIIIKCIQEIRRNWMEIKCCLIRILRTTQD